jgi:hypothetical protein
VLIFCTHWYFLQNIEPLYTALVLPTTKRTTDSPRHHPSLGTRFWSARLTRDFIFCSLFASCCNSSTNEILFGSSSDWGPVVTTAPPLHQWKMNPLCRRYATRWDLQQTYCNAMWQEDALLIANRTVPLPIIRQSTLAKFYWLYFTGEAKRRGIFCFQPPSYNIGCRLALFHVS